MLPAKTLRECQRFDLLNALCDLSLSMQNSGTVLACLMHFSKVCLSKISVFPTFFENMEPRQMLPLETGCLVV